MDNLSIILTKIKARQVLDSRGNPTVEVEVHSNVAEGRAMVPSGASTGKFEAWELRDNGKSYGGKSVEKAVNNVNMLIAPKLMGGVLDQKQIDKSMIALDGTTNKSRLGANAILGVSLAAARCSAHSYGVPLYSFLDNYFQNKGTYNKSYQAKRFVLPIPFANIINGGKHAESQLKFQEFMVAPIKAKSFADATQMVVEVYHDLKKVIETQYGKSAANVGDEGGFAPPLKSPEEALNLIVKAIEEAGYQKKVRIAMDCAASEFYVQGRYNVTEIMSKNRDELIDYYSSLVKQYGIISIEDPFDQEDYEAFAMFTQKNRKLQIVGDDLLVTNPAKIQMALTKNLCNALLLKVNQIGSLSEAMDAAFLAKANKWNVMVSHRSGETEDPFIADLTVALGVGQIKLGAPCRGERTAKYNQLLRIEDELGRNSTMQTL
jgi:enolase